jgi:hypothetical protein
MTASTQRRRCACAIKAGADSKGISGRSAAAAAGLLLPMLVAGFCASTVHAAQIDAAQPSATTAQSPAPAARKKSPYHPESVPRSGRNFIAATKGVDELKVRRTNAGNLIRFSYRVTNADQAKALNDKKATPYLIGHTSHAMLQVPVMDKVGPLRQATAPEAGKEYWVMFSNKGDVVKAGERVSIVIGSFRVDGLLVE